MTNEKTLHKQVCEYLKIAYPNVLFNTDLSGAFRLTIGQAKALKKLRSNKGWPDIQICEPRNGYHGLFIELKAEDTTLLKKKMLDQNGYPMWSTPHIKEQHEMIERLNELGYKAEFAIGWNEAKKLIDNYLKK